MRKPKPSFPMNIILVTRRQICKMVEVSQDSETFDGGSTVTPNLKFRKDLLLKERDIHWIDKAEVPSESDNNHRSKMPPCHRWEGTKPLLYRITCNPDIF